MTFVSHAQNFEDVILWRVLQNVSHGFYVDVGAYSPSVDSVTRAFYERGWHGINIEPNPTFYAALLAERVRDINLHLAVSNKPGIALLKVIEDTGLTTLDPAIAAQHQASGWRAEEIEVDAETLSNILSEHVEDDQTIHFLKIDVEGHEREVIEGMDFVRWRPWVVLVESTVPSSSKLATADWENRILDSGYIFAHFDGLNKYYLHHSQQSLRDRLSLPPNVFDEFVSSRVVAAEERARRFENELIQIKNSLPWRASRPLRWLRRKLKKS